MNALQERLRANPLPLPSVMGLCREAADRIDALERKARAWERLYESMDAAGRRLMLAQMDELIAEIDAARSKT